VTFDETEVRRVLPDRQARARRSPRLHRLGVRALARADPFEQVEDQRLDRRRFAQAFSQRVDARLVTVPDRDRVTVQLAKAPQRAERVEVIVEDRDVHGALLATPSS